MKKKPIKKPFISAFARFHKYQKVQQHYPASMFMVRPKDETIYRVEARLMDLDSSNIIYFCRTEEGQRHTFLQSQLKAVE